MFAKAFKVLARFSFKTVGIKTTSMLDCLRCTEWALYDRINHIWSRELC